MVTIPVWLLIHLELHPALFQLQVSYSFSYSHNHAERNQRQLMLSSLQFVYG